MKMLDAIRHMHFDPAAGSWSPIIFWYVVVSTILTVGFTVVVVVGGFFDLLYLLKSLREEKPEATDDGRITDPTTSSK